MTSSVPLSLFVSATPSVIAAAGTSLGMNAVMLSQNPTVPIGTLQGFGTQAEVGEQFGTNSLHYQLAGIYFSGFNGADKTPSALYFAQYNTAAVSAYLRSAGLTLSLAQLQALSGDIIVSINGETVTSAAINLASATSFTAAAALIQTGLQATGSIFQGTVALTINNTTMTVDAVTSGSLHVGDPVTDLAGALPAGTTIAAFGTGTGGTGTYTLSHQATATNGADTVYVTSTATVSYNSQLNAFQINSPTTGVNSLIAYPTDTSLSPALSFTAATGAVLSQGAAPATPASLMTAIQNSTSDWATFMTIFDPDNGAAGGPIKQQFAEWNSQQNAQFLYVPWDTDPTPSTTLPDAACFAQQIASLNGSFPIWDSSAAQAASVAAFVCGMVASIVFTNPDGRVAFDSKGSPALTPDINSLSVFMNVTGTAQAPGNGYNSYVNVASRTASFQWLERGTVTGPWDWADSYVNQIYWNSQFQEDLATYKNNSKSLPYVQPTYTGIHQALASDIDTMGEFGAWQAGVALSALEIQEANQAAGANIGGTLQTQGWYLLVADPGATVRQTRGSPIIKYFYVDGDSVQSMNLTSTDIE